MRALGRAAVLLGCLGAFASPGHAQTSSEYGQIRQDLLDVISKELADAKQVTFRVRWQYLPKFTESGKVYLPLKGGSSNSEFKLPNSVFSDKDGWKKWSARNPQQAVMLARAIGGKDQLEESLKSLYPNDSWTNWFEVQSGKSSQTAAGSFRAWRDAAVMSGFFGSLFTPSSMKYGGVILDVSPAPRGGARRIINKGAWSIRVKEVGRLRHFEAEFLSDPITLTFRKGLTGKATLTALSGMIEETPEGAFINADSTIKLVGEAAPVSPPSTPSAAKSDASSSVGTYVLDLIAGSGYKGLLAPLIENDSEASLFQGALLFGGKPVPLYGLNFLLSETRSAKLGFMYGVIGKANETLYLGPSMSVGPLTLTLGGRFATKDDNRADVRFSGGVSVDLTRLLSRKDSSTILEAVRKDKTPVSVWAPLDERLRASQVAMDADLKERLKDQVPCLLTEGGVSKFVGLGEGLLIYRVGGTGSQEATLTPSSGWIKVEDEAGVKTWVGPDLPIAAYDLPSNQYLTEIKLLDFKVEAARIAVVPTSGSFSPAAIKFVGCEQYESDPLPKNVVVLFPGAYEIKGAVLSFKGQSLTTFRIGQKGAIEMGGGMKPAGAADPKILADPDQKVIITKKD